MFSIKQPSFWFGFLDNRFLGEISAQADFTNRQSQRAMGCVKVGPGQG
jgi:hypothetical protein